ncbi:MAG: hypothetical protein NW220_02465 [Leptolyngbyaceae cyanobacterium bins.349]|nr:hypothetical protein [Leptolyngbyaceae cyanobacterium bins.349]
MSLTPKSIHSRIAIILGCTSLTLSLTVFSGTHLSSAQHLLFITSTQGQNFMSDKSIMIVMAVLKAVFIAH